MRWAASLLRAIVFALVMPLASSGALPFWAQLVGVEGPHICHCSIEKHDCVCAKCNPDQDDMLLTSESLKGRCGDDEVAFGGKALSAVLVAPSVLAPAAVRTAIVSPAVPAISDLARPPPTPPPRSSKAAPSAV